MRESIDLSVYIGIGGIGPFDFNAGASFPLDVAYIWAGLYDGTALSSAGC
ncbi:MAG: hypothetical protein R2759_04190 [Bacteroidales bacterium]